MKLVITVPWGERFGGAEQMLLTFLRHVDPGRVQPLVAFHVSGPLVDEVRRLGVRTALLPAFRLRNPFQLARTITGLAGLLRAERPDLVLAWTTKTQLTSALAVLGSGLACRVAWWQQGNASGALLDRVATVLPARAVICYSTFSAASQSSLRPRRRTLVVNPGAEEPTGRPLGRAELGIPESSFVIGIVARLHPMKRQDLVLRAVRMLLDRGIDAHGLVVGGVAHGQAKRFAAELAELARDLRIEHAVTFTGQLADATEALPAMDVLVNVSHEEPFGIGLLEAMAAGIPVVACAHSGSAEAVEDVGILLERVGADSLTVALETLAGDEARRQDLALRGRLRYESRFTAAAAALRVQDAVEEIARLG